jgi:hypothetical protein
VDRILGAVRAMHWIPQDRYLGQGSCQRQCDDGSCRNNLKANRELILEEGDDEERSVRSHTFLGMRLESQLSI